MRTLSIEEIEITMGGNAVKVIVDAVKSGLIYEAVSAVASAAANANLGQYAGYFQPYNYHFDHNRYA